MPRRATNEGGALGLYPLSIIACTQGRVSTLCWLAWVRPHAWLAAPPQPQGHNSHPSTPCVLHCHLLQLGLHLLVLLFGLLLFNPPPRPAASFSSSFFLFFSFFFSFLLLFLSWADKSDDTLLKGSPAVGDLG